MRFSTESLDLSDQFDAWREQLGTHFGIAEVSRETDGPFRATIETHSLGRLETSQLFGDAMTFDRTFRHVAHRHRDDYTLGLLLEGRALVEQGGRCASISPGDLVICDDRRPMRIHFGGAFRQIVFHCDRSQFEADLPDLDLRTAQRIEGRAAMAVAVADYVASIAGQAAMPVAAELSVAQHAQELLALAVGDVSSQDAASRSRLASIRRYIESHLSDPDLTPATIARHHRISRRHLYRLFESDGDTVADLIRRRRLLRCKAILGDERSAKRSISEIAFSNGFDDATTFGRAFRAAFGMTPTEYRKMAARDPRDRALRSKC